MQGWGEQGRAERWQAKLHSSAFLFHLFTFTVSSNSPPPVPYTQWVHGVVIFFRSSLSQIKFRKHQLPVYLQIYTIQAEVIMSCAGDPCQSRCIHLSVAPIPSVLVSTFHCDANAPLEFSVLCLIMLCEH